MQRQNLYGLPKGLKSMINLHKPLKSYRGLREKNTFYDEDIKITASFLILMYVYA